MKKVNLFLSILLLSISFLSAQFEGKVTMTTTSEESTKVTFVLKDDRVKIVPDALGDNEAEIYMDGKSSDLIIIMGNGEERMGMKMNLNSKSMFAAQMRMAMDNAEEEGKTDVKLNWTGIMKTVNGQKCEKVTGSNDEGEFTAWVTKGLGLSFTDLFPINSPMTEELKNEMFGNSGFEGFPMQIITTQSDGTEQTMNASVEKMSISKSEMAMDGEVDLLDMDNIMQEIMAAQESPEKQAEIMKKMERFQKMMGN